MRILPLLTIALLAGACGRKTPAPETVRSVKVTTAAGAGIIDKDFAGMATPDDAVNLAFKVAGQVLDVPVAQGQSVKKGALLAELDPRDIELQVAATRSAFEEARSQQQRMQRLVEHEAVSRQEAEAASTRYAQARSTYENTLDLLKDTRLRAPFAGVVERKYVDNFERVQAGQSILRLVNPVTTTVQFTLPETGLSLLRDSSTRFTVEFDNYRGAAIPARLKEYVETSSDASGFPVSLTLENPDPARYARYVVHDHHAERRSGSRRRVAARVGRLRSGRGRHLCLDRGRRRPRHAPRGEARGVVRPRPRGHRQRRRAGRQGRHGRRLPAARRGAGPDFKMTLR